MSSLSVFGATVKIKWKKYFNPDSILKQLEGCKKVQNEQVSFSLFDSIEYEITLASMLDFGADISAADKSNLVRKALFSCAKSKINRRNFGTAIMQELKLYKREEGEEVEFQLLTTISIKAPFHLDTTINGCKIIISHSHFVEKYDSRKNLLDKETRSCIDRNLLKSYIDFEKQYCKAIVLIRSSNPIKAARKCLNALNILRFLLCVRYNPYLSIFSSSSIHKPLNKIVLGKFHTIHKTSGVLATDIYWYKPNYTRVIPYRIKVEQKQTIEKDIQFYCNQIDNLEDKDRKKLTNAALRFIDAYDQTDYNTTLLMGWASLEYLIANEKESNTDAITKRCSFLYNDSDLHKQIIEHIREYRNKNVHQGESIEDPSIICYQLQRYFYDLFWFCLSSAGTKEFENLGEVNLFLDLPKDVSILKHRANLIEKAIKYRSPNRSSRK